MTGRDTIIPNFFIVGAPKSGTSFLHYYLNQHPDIYFPIEKELYYFGSDLHFKRPRIELPEFLAYYKDVNQQHIIGDATATSLYSQKAAEEIKLFNANAKILIILRNPIEMVYSMHSELLYWGDENLTDFNQALDVIPERKNGKFIPDNIYCPVQALYYDEIALYSEQVTRFLNTFGNNVKILLYDDMKMDQKKTYLQILDFLEIKGDVIPQFKKINSNKKVRINFIRDSFRQLNENQKKILRVIIPSKNVRDKGFQLVNKINTANTRRPSITTVAKEKLLDFYSEDIKKLSSIINRNLDHWTI